MRFNCQSCGAKYQIADEKVAGKTVRMKCRKCGDLIQVRAHKTGAGVAPSYASGAPGGAAPATPRPSSASMRPVGAPTPRPSGVGLPPRPRPSGIGAPPPRPSAPSPRPSSLGLRGAAARPAPAPAASDLPDPDEATVIMQRPDSAEFEAAMARGPRPAAGAAAAPSPPVAQPKPAPAPQPASLPEWYVGIDGEPVGPIDVAYLKTQIDAGKVNATSLVWREELTDWKPLNTFAELRKLIPEPQEKPVPPAGQVSDPVALTRLKDSEPDAAAKPSGDSAAGADGAAASEAAAAAGAVAASPAAAADSQLAAPPTARGPSDSELAELAGIKVPERRGKRRGMHPMAYAFIAMAAAFGGVAAWVMFTSKTSTGSTTTETGAPTAAPTASQTAAAQGEGGGATEPAGSAIQIAEVEVGPGADEQLAMVGSTAGGSSSAGKTGPEPAPKTNGTKPCNPSDPFCSPNVEGPSAGGPSGDSGQSGQGLTPAQAQSVVNANRHAVSRRCMSYVSGKGGSAKIAVTLVVSPSGSVQSAAVSGGKDYPGLASCVRSRVQNWKFPASGASTTINVSFNFLAQ